MQVTGVIVGAGPIVNRCHPCLSVVIYRARSALWRHGDCRCNKRGRCDRLSVCLKTSSFTTVEFTKSFTWRGWRFQHGIERWTSVSTVLYRRVTCGLLVKTFERTMHLFYLSLLVIQKCFWVWLSNWSSVLNNLIYKYWMFSRVVRNVIFT